MSTCEADMRRVRTKPVRDAMTKKERTRLHKNIAITIRPQSHGDPPANLGEEKHGKLPADVLRTLIEFDLPVNTVDSWSKNVQPANTDPDVAERNDKKFRATMYLSMAIRVATSFRTSAEHAEKYTKYMKAYLELLLDLYPGMSLTPNQHRALHIGSGLARFGPAPGWWMFPFERLIGVLQKMNHNFKIGQYMHISLNLTTTY